MSLSSLDAQGQLASLRKFLDDGGEAYSVHYACQSWDDSTSGPPQIAAIGFKSLRTDQTFVCSRQDRPADEDNPDKYVLDEYFSFLNEHQDARLMCWEMNTDPYGFRSIANRYAHVTRKEPPPLPGAHQIVALDRLVQLVYGEDFADRPRLRHLGDLNGITLDGFLDGPEEARLFKDGDFFRITRSLHCKIKIIAEIAERLIEGSLDTKRLGRRLRYADATLDSIGIVFAIGARFRQVAYDLYRRELKNGQLPLQHEADFQNLFLALLRLFFDNIRREDPIPQNAGASSRIDFRLPEFKIGIELKDASKWSDKDIGEQLTIDRQRYENLEIRHLLCLVFDYSRKIANPRGLESDLTGKTSGGMRVQVRVFQE
jgi:hypothetical protein